MEFLINRDLLLDNLLIMQRGLPNRTPLPILNTIKFEVRKDFITLTSSNNDIAIELKLDSSSDLIIKKEGTITIPGRFLIDIIRKITSQQVEFSLIEDKLVVIRADRSEFKLRLMDHNDYPNIEFLEDTKDPLVIKSKVLKEIIKETNYATAITEKRPILTGVNFRYIDNVLYLVATDSYRLSQKIIELKSNIEDFNLVIPSKSLDELSKILDQVETDVELYINDNRVLFKIDNIVFQTRLLEGNYPDTMRIIPKEFPVVVPFNKEELLAAVERVSLLSPKDRETNYNIIKLHLRPDHSVEISSTNSELGDAQEIILPSGDVEGPMLKIAFSSKYLVEALKSFNSPEVNIKFAGEVKPFVIEGTKDEKLLNLILPVRID